MAALRPAPTSSSPRGASPAPHPTHWMQRVLIGITLIFVGLFLVIPLVSVFYEALRAGAEL